MVNRMFFAKTPLCNLQGTVGKRACTKDEKDEHKADFAMYIQFNPTHSPRHFKSMHFKFKCLKSLRGVKVLYKL